MFSTRMDMDMNNIDINERSSFRKRIIQSIIDVIVIILIFAIFILVLVFVDPRIRYMTCDESDIFYPDKPDTVPFWAVGIFATIGPILFIILVELINSRLFCCQYTEMAVSKADRRRKFLICWFHATSLFVLGISITLTLTEIGKRWVGRLRPHFIDVCKPDLASLNCTLKALTGTVYLPINTGGNFCTGAAKDVEEARLSFPSGHSSYSFYCMVFLIIYLEARLFLLRFRYVKPLIQMAAFIAAYITAISRIGDYHHRGSDVIGGSVLGIVIALFITLFVGRVLWDYGAEKKYADFDLKENKVTRTF